MGSPLQPSAQAPSSPTTNIESLPIEVLQKIIDLVEDRQDLRSLCLTKSVFAAQVERRLYESLRLVDPVTVTKLCGSILRRSQLALHVRRVNLVLFPFHGRWGNLSEPAFARLVYRSLRLMTRLRHLRISNQSPGHWTSKNLLGCSFQLEVMELNVVGGVELEFLKSQPSLEELRFFDYDTCVTDTEHHQNVLSTFPQTALPRLRALSAPFWMIRGLIAHRPVREVRLVEKELSVEILKEGLPKLALSSGPVQFLSMELPYLDGVVQIIAEYLPHLTELVICLESDEGIDVMTTLEDASCQFAFKKLNYLETLDIYADKWRTLSIDDHLPFVIGMGNACSALSQVTFGGALPERPHDVKVGVVYKRETSIAASLEGLTGDWKRDDRLCLMGATSHMDRDTATPQRLGRGVELPYLDTILLWACRFRSAV